MKPQIVDFPLTHFAGFVTDLRTTVDAPNNIRGIPDLWQSLNVILPKLDRVGEERYVYITGDIPGSCTDVARYHALVQVANPLHNQIAPVTLSLGPGKLAKFAHRGPPNTISTTSGPVFLEWLPSSGYQLAVPAELIVLPPSYDRTDPRSLLDYCVLVR